MTQFDTRFRIYLGHNIPGESRKVDPAQATAMVAWRHDGFTAYSAVGYWKGDPEAVTVFEILGTQPDAETIGETARRLKKAYGQESVMVTAEPVPVVSFV